MWQLLTAPDSKAYNPDHGLIAPLELISHFALLSRSILLLVLFFRRSYLFPRLMQISLACLMPVSLFFTWDNVTLAHKT